jgi:hypothetical protein
MNRCEVQGGYPKLKEKAVNPNIAIFSPGGVPLELHFMGIASMLLPSGLSTGYDPRQQDHYKSLI